MPVSFNEINENANGGTEMMARRLADSFSEEELNHVQIIPSRVRELMDDKIRVFWCHDLPHDPESKNVLVNEGWRKFERIVFVSHWQKQQYIDTFQIPYEKCVVIQNAITPFTAQDISTKGDPKEKLKIIYHTTPHRGLDIAYHAIDKLSEIHPEIEFNVFSSFAIYGWEQRDEDFQQLFEAIESHPNMVYHGTVDNSVVRKHLGESHIFAYPSIWPETSCISLMEAMSAKLLCIHSDYAALPETAANWTYMYPFNDNKTDHLDIFASCLNQGILALKDDNQKESMETRLMSQKGYADLFYSWDLRKHNWRHFLDSLRNMTPSSTTETIDYAEEEFVYGTD